MKYFSLLILVFIFSSCMNGLMEENAENATKLQGTWKEKTYFNSVFGLKITLSDNWKLKKKLFKMKSTFGATFIDAEYFLASDTIYPLVTMKFECDKINPFERNVSEKNSFEEDNSFTTSLYKEDELIMEGIKKVKLGNKTYYSNNIIFLENGDTTYLQDYKRIENGYFLNLNFSYKSFIDKVLVEEILKQL